MHIRFGDKDFSKKKAPRKNNSSGRLGFHCCLSCEKPCEKAYQFCWNCQQLRNYLFESWETEDLPESESSCGWYSPSRAEIKAERKRIDLLHFMDEF